MPAASACARKSGPQSMRTRRVPEGEERGRAAGAGRAGRRTCRPRQSQAIRGTPWLVPLPRIVTTRRARVRARRRPGRSPAPARAELVPAASRRPRLADRRGGSPSVGGGPRPDRIPSRGRRTTSAGPPAATRSSASFARASAARFSLRGTCRALQRRKPPETRRRLGVERGELGVLHPPAAAQLLHDEHRVEQEGDLLGAQLRGQGRARAGRPCTRRRCWSGGRAPREIVAIGGASGPLGAGRVRVDQDGAGRRRARDCRAPPRRSGR